VKKLKTQVMSYQDERVVVLAMLKSLYGDQMIEIGEITPNTVHAWVGGRPVILRRNRDADDQILGRADAAAQEKSAVEPEIGPTASNKENAHGKENEDA
jgi:hypothetical protein